MEYILGISCFYHDSAVCFLRDGKILFAAEEERFSRKKHDSDFPVRAISYALKTFNLTIQDIAYVGFYEKPLLKFERILTMFTDTFPFSFPAFKKAIPSWTKEKLRLRNLLSKHFGFQGEIFYIEHHLSHAASAYFVSPFQEAAVLTVDGVGEWASATLGKAEGNTITLLKELRFPDSLGMLYSAFTYYLGFKVNYDEYKVMGLAPYGKPLYAKVILENLLDLKGDGSLAVNLYYFNYARGSRMINSRFESLFGRKARSPRDPIEPFHQDVAASIQKVCEEVLLKMAAHLYSLFPSDNLCLAGGVALNCVANGRLLRESPFKNIFIQPAAGDSGGAVGVAKFIHHAVLGHEKREVMKHALHGPSYTDEEIERFLREQGVRYRRCSEEGLTETLAIHLANQKIVGWFQGRAEFGPRALGSRSILADSRNPDMKDRINLRVKFREDFRPFAPSVIKEEVGRYFELDRESPFMLLVAQVKEGRNGIPAVTHVDRSARIQTVSETDNPLYYRLLKAYARLTGIPILINTSFNTMGEPIVHSISDAFHCFMNTDMDVLAVGSFLLEKERLFSEEESEGSLALQLEREEK